MRRIVSVFMSLLLASCAVATAQTHSVLATGRWFKVGIEETGIQKLTYSDLNDLGLDVDHLDPRQLRVYHNGGGLLGELNASPRPDDLSELPIFVSGEADGSFDRNDYVLFYARGPITWRYDRSSGLFEYQANAYDDYAYAFVTADLGTGRRIATQTAPSGAASATVTEFLDYQVHDKNSINLINGGRTYYGEVLDGNSNLSLDFTFHNARANRPCSVSCNLAGRNFQPASFEVYVNGQLKKTFNIQTTSSASTKPFSYGVSGTVDGAVNGDLVKVNLKHVGVSGTTSFGYVDYVAVNTWRSLRFTGTQMLFRNPEANDPNTVYQFQMTGMSSATQVWDVTDSIHPAVVNGQLSGSTFSFKMSGNAKNEYIAFDGSSFHTPALLGTVDNQDLHGDRNYDYLIVVHPEFLDQAQRLKAIHAEYDPDLKIKIATTEQIYNEFSCGALDICAIRDYCRMLYNDSRPLRYLLLFGDASFDYKNRNGLVNFVPTYESVRSTDILSNMVTDDFFSFMDENEGAMSGSKPDIGVGRFPVSTVEQAEQVVDKVEHYLDMNERTMAPWRNVITFMCDDAESNQFFLHSEGFEAQIQNTGGKNLVVDKLYLDAFNQESTPNGQLAPDFNAAINNRMEKGTLVLNYVGHGGEVQLAEERILQRADVFSWRNGPCYPLMITGTCEFSRYDDHKRTSLGEYAFLNQYGGMIAMFTTSRVTNGGNNREFITSIYNHLFEIENGQRRRLGDVYRMGKQIGSEAERRYVFFGDPVLRLPMPKWTVETTSIDDTLQALKPATIQGVVRDLDGQVANNFNGLVYVSVYDKASVYTTKGDEETAPKEFSLYNSILFNGKTEVVNGRFSIDFIVPRDISFRYGNGMVSYYATDGENDASGKFEDFVIGGFYEDAVMDETSPDVRLFIDDERFVSGGLTGDSPTLIAYIEDESGINTTGTGIGHNIVASLTGPTEASYVLNDHFITDLGYQGKGKITYRMQNLAEGDYLLTLKVWDIYNNSGTATIAFKVAGSDLMVLEEPLCFPNPVRNEAYFSFGHNQIGNNMKVQIKIFDVMGRHVTTLNEVVEGTSARANPIPWNGRASNGAKLSAGVYVYTITATNDQGNTASITSKLLITN